MGPLIFPACPTSPGPPPLASVRERGKNFGITAFETRKTYFGASDYQALCPWRTTAPTP